MSTQNIGNIADFYGLFTYQDTLIYFGIENHDDWRHREIALRYDPYIRAYIRGLDEELFAEKPIMKPNIFGDNQETSLDEIDSEEPVEVDANIMTEESTSTDVSEDWDRERWNNLHAKFFDKSRVHSFSIVKLYNAPPYWRVYTHREIKKIVYDDNNIATHVYIEWSKSLPHSEKFITFREDFDLYHEGNQTADALLIPFGVPHNEEELGEYDLSDKWTTSVYIRYSDLDITSNSAKTSGFLHVVFGTAITPTSRQAFINALDMAGSTRGTGAKRNVVEEILPIFPQKPEFTVVAKGEHVKTFAFACRLPLSYFRAEQEGSNGGFGMGGDLLSGDESKINKKKMFLFGKFKPYIKTLIMMRWGIIIEDCEPFIYETEKEELEVTPLDQERALENDKGSDLNK